VRRLLFVLLLPLPALALSPAAKEFMEISAKLEPVQCEKRQLRRQMAMAQAERRDGDLKTLRARVAELNRDKQTARLEQRLAELEKRISDGKGGTRDPEDLQAISFQQRQAFYRCE
jgi:predicted nuclease with TOPRIM domain